MIINENKFILRIEEGKLKEIKKLEYNSINTIYIPNKIGEYEIKVIGPYVLKGISDPLTVEIADGISLSEYSFAQSSIVSVALPSDIKEIPECCFYSSSLTSIKIPDSVTVVGRSAFEDTKITNIRWSSNCSTIPEYCFSNCARLESITNIQDVSEIRQGAFGECWLLEEFEWPINCIEIPEFCFAYCKNLQSISNIGMINKINKNAFYGTHINVEELKKNMFYLVWCE